MSGENLWNLYWPCAEVPDNVMLKSYRRRQTIKSKQSIQKQSTKSVNAETGKSESETQSRIPEPPVLGSIGDFALEIDRMKLLEKKSELIGSVLKGDTITYGSSDCAGKGDAVEERRIVGHSVHRAREKLERKLHQLHQNGIFVRTLQSI